MKTIKIIIIGIILIISMAFTLSSCSNTSARSYRQEKHTQNSTPESTIKEYFVSNDTLFIHNSLVTDRAALLGVNILMENSDISYVKIY